MPAFGQSGELTEEKLLAWLKSQHAEAMNPPPLGSIKLAFVRSYMPEVSPVLMARWREEVSGRPEHPSRLLLDPAEQRIQDGPEEHEITIWYAGERHWRMSETRPSLGNQPMFFDVARKADTWWNMSPSSMTIDRDGTSQLRNGFAPVRGHLSRFLHGGLSRAKFAPGFDEQVEINGTSWTYTAVDEKNRAWKCSGTWDAALDRGFVAHIGEFSDLDGPPDLSFEFGPWEQAIPGVWTPEFVISHQYTDRELFQRIRFDAIELEVVGTAAVEQVLRVPDPRGRDHVRGTLAVGQVAELSKGSIIAQSDGHEMVSRQPGTTYRPNPRVRWLSIAAVAGIVVTLVVLKLRRQ